MKEAIIQGFKDSRIRGLKGLKGKANHSTPNPLNPGTLLLKSMSDVRCPIFGPKGFFSFFNSKFKIQNSKLGFKAFTLIELIIVIILAGILVAAVAVRISLSPSQIASVTAVDQAVADIQYVQMRALSGRTTSGIAFTNGSPTYTISGATSETKTLPSGTTAGTTVTFTFNSLGELTGGANKTLSLGGRTITVYRITGKVTVT